MAKMPIFPDFPAWKRAAHNIPGFPRPVGTLRTFLGGLSAGEDNRPADTQGLSLCRTQQARIQDFGRGGQQSFDPKGGGALSPKCAQNRDFPL